MNIDAFVNEVTKRVIARIGADYGSSSGDFIASTIEHSLMNPDTTRDTILQACKDVRELGMANICVSPYYVPTAAEYGGITVCTAIAFPYGAATTPAKLEEIHEAIKNGAGELDVSINILAVKNADLYEVIRDLDAMISAVRGRAVVKAIYEQCMYTEAEKIQVLEIIKKSGADYVKISNAISGNKAVAEDVRFVRGILGSAVGIKIDGGISDSQTVRELMAAGADRFGCSKSVQIIKG